MSPKDRCWVGIRSRSNSARSGCSTKANTAHITPMASSEPCQPNITTKTGISTPLIACPTGTDVCLAENTSGINLGGE